MNKIVKYLKCRYGNKYITFILDVLFVVIAYIVFDGKLYYWLQSLFYKDELDIFSLFAPAFIIFGILVVLPIIRRFVEKKLDEKENKDA